MQREAEIEASLSDHRLRRLGDIRDQRALGGGGTQPRHREARHQFAIAQHQHVVAQGRDIGQMRGEAHVLADVARLEPAAAEAPDGVKHDR